MSDGATDLTQALIELRRRFDLERASGSIRLPGGDLMTIKLDGPHHLEIERQARDGEITTVRVDVPQGGGEIEL